MTHHYSCYGLHIRSELELPELASHVHAEGAVDLVLRIARVPADGFVESDRISQVIWVDEDTQRLQIKGLARYEMNAGREIIIDPAPDGDPLAVRTFLLGAALGTALMQRGYLLLHGNAIRIGDACMICIGNSKAGKSTLAAAFLQRGHEVLADDVTPVRDDGMALPGFPRIKLWQDAADRLGIATQGLMPVLTGLEKFNLPLQSRRATPQPLPVRWIYLLDWHDQPDVQMTSINGMARFATLNEHTYRRRFMQGGDRLSNHLSQCAALSKSARIVRIARPAGGAHPVEETVRLIMADIEASAS